MGHDGVELAAANRAQERGALDEVVARHGQQPALRQTRNRVSRAADTLQEGRDAAGRSDLTDEIDVADVDAELQGRRGHERRQAAALQPLLRVAALLLREAAVVRGHRVLAEALAQMPRDALRQPPRIDEHERRAVRRNERREPIVVLVPDLVSHHRLDRRAGQLDPEIHGAAMAFVHDGARRRRPLRRVPAPTRKRATASIGFCVADRPTRTSGDAATCCSRSSVRARCAPRLVPITAWISSTMTVRTVRSMSRLFSAVRSR